MSRAGEAARRGAGNAPAGPGSGRDARRRGGRRGAARFRRRARAGQVLGLRGGARRAPPRRQPRPGGRQAAEEAGDHSRRDLRAAHPRCGSSVPEAARSARGRDRRAPDARRPLRPRAGAEDHPGLVGRAGAACLGRARRRTLRAGEQSRRPQVPEEARADRRRDRRTPDAGALGIRREAKTSKPSPPKKAPAKEAPAKASSRGKRVAAVAQRYLGIPYRWGGESPRTGFDCSGFVMYVFSRVGISLPRVVSAQYRVGKPVKARSGRATSSLRRPRPRRDLHRPWPLRALPELGRRRQDLEHSRVLVPLALGRRQASRRREPAAQGENPWSR